MQSGKLRNRVTIERPVRAVNASGQSILSWEAIAIVWADIRSVSGKEFYAQDKPGAVATHNIFIRWMDGLDETMRIVWGDRIFNVVHVGEDRTHERSMSLVVMENK